MDSNTEAAATGRGQHHRCGGSWAWPAVWLHLRPSACPIPISLSARSLLPGWQMTAATASKTTVAWAGAGPCAPFLPAPGVPRLFCLIPRLPRKEEGLRYARQRAQRRQGRSAAVQIPAAAAAGQCCQQRHPQLLSLRGPKSRRAGGQLARAAQELQDGKMQHTGGSPAGNAPVMHFAPKAITLV